MNPLGEVMSLLDTLTAKVTAEGEAEAKAYKEFFEWCDDASKNFGFAIKTAEAKKEMAKNPAAFAQMDTSNMGSLLKTLSTIVDAASFSTADSKRLQAFVQQNADNQDDDDAPGAPAAAVYKTHSSSIFDVLEDLKE